MTRRAMGFCAALIGLAALMPAAARENAAVTVLALDGPIDPIAARYIERGLRRSRDEGAQLAVITLDTRGGLETSMNRVIAAIASSPVPVAVYVSPEGARVAPAGTLIAMAAAIAAMAPGTAVATAGGDVPDAARRLRALAKERGRAVPAADGALLSDAQALSARLVDLRAADLQGLLRSLDGRRVKTASGTVVLHTSGAPLDRVEMGPADRFLSVFANPDLAYVLLVIGALGILFELTTPGIGLPGIGGAIAVVLALVGFGSLPINLGGLLIIGLAVVLFLVDIKAPSHGIWTAGGIAAFIIGSLFLFPPWKALPFPAVPELRLSALTIAAMTVAISLFFSFIIVKGIAAQRRWATTPADMGSAGVAVTELDPDGQVVVSGERWSARSTAGKVAAGSAVTVVGREGLRLTVRGPAVPEDKAGGAS